MQKGNVHSGLSEYGSVSAWLQSYSDTMHFGSLISSSDRVSVKNIAGATQVERGIMGEDSKRE